MAVRRHSRRALVVLTVLDLSARWVYRGATLVRWVVVVDRRGHIRLVRAHIRLSRVEVQEQPRRSVELAVDTHLCTRAPCSAAAGVAVSAAASRRLLRLDLTEIRVATATLQLQVEPTPISMSLVVARVDHICLQRISRSPLRLPVSNSVVVVPDRMLSTVKGTVMRRSR